MKALQQLSKIISSQRTPRALLVTKTLGLIILVIVFSCELNKVKEDLVIRDIIITNVKERNEGNYVLISESYDNSLVIEYLETTVRAESSERLEIPEKFASIFTIGQLDCFITQKSEGGWSNEVLPIVESNDNNFREVNLFISKPVYSCNKDYAFIEFIENTKAGFLLLSFDGESWREELILEPKFVQNKAEYKSQ